MKKQLSIIATMFILSTSAGGVLAEEMTKKVAEYTLRISDKNYSISGNPKYIENLNGYSRWLVVAGMPPRKLSSGHCLLRKIEYYLGEKSDVIELESKVATKLISVKKHQSCPAESKSYIVVNNEFSNRVAIKHLNLLSNILKAAKEKKCYKKFSCRENVVLKLQSVSIDDLIEIEREENNIVTFMFLSESDPEGNFVKSLTLQVSTGKKVIEMDAGFFEIEN